MHLEFLVEELSTKVALTALLPRLVGPGVEFVIHAFQGKRDLMIKLSSRLQGYSHWLPEDWRIVVLIDEDREDCRQLKAQLEQAAADAGLMTRSTAPSRFQVLNRIVVEELEAWYFGDVEALVRAFPRVPDIANRRGYRDPDAIRGGTWETLERVLQQAGYYPGGLAKIDAARRIAAHMDPQPNRSGSFRAFSEGLGHLLASGPGAGG